MIYIYIYILEAIRYEAIPLISSLIRAKKSIGRRTQTELLRIKCIINTLF